MQEHGAVVSRKSASRFYRSVIGNRKRKIEMRVFDYRIFSQPAENSVCSDSCVHRIILPVENALEVSVLLTVGFVKTSDLRGHIYGNIVVEIIITAYAPARLQGKSLDKFVGGFYRFRIRVHAFENVAAKRR